MEILGLILAVLLCILTGYAIGKLICDDFNLQWGHRKKDEYDGVLIINDSPEKQSWDINVNTELYKLAKKRYIMLEVRYHQSSKYKKEPLSEEMQAFIDTWEPREEDE